MSDQYSMFGPTISEDSPSATSSPESADGPAPSDSPDGPMTGRSGPDHAPVSRFRSRDSEKAMPTNDTSGPLFTTSSPSASLQRSLANRLHQNLDVNGSPEFALTWKAVDMPAGVPICALRASGRRTSGKDYGGWPTPVPSSGDQTAANPTPKQTGGDTLGGIAKLAGWPTPNVPNGGRSISHAEQKGGTYYHEGKKVQVGLEAAAKMTGWPTPIEDDASNVMRSSGFRSLTSPEVWPNTGTANTSPAQTEKRGALNPAFSLWLMGYPTEWARCAARVTRSYRRSGQSS